MKVSKKNIINYLENTNLILINSFLFLLPLFFLSQTTDPFILPKQILMTCIATLSSILIGFKIASDGKIKFRTTPFDFPIFLLAVFIFLSAVFSVNRSDALTTYIPFFFLTILYYNVTNTIKNANSVLSTLLALVLGASTSAIITVCSYFQFFILPFSYTHEKYFNTFGSLLDQAIYFSLIIPIAGYFIFSLLNTLYYKNKKTQVFNNNQESPENEITISTILFSIGFFLLIFGLTITIYQLTTSEKPLILPIETGFQTAFAAISQDTSRIFGVFTGFLFGSGYGTFVTDFTRFKSQTYNLNPSLWSLTFFHSSTLIFELLATTGVLGLLSFLYLIFSIIKEKNFFLPLILCTLLIFILPFSFTLVILFYILLAIFAVIQAHNNPKKFAEVEVSFLTLKQGFVITKNEKETIPQKIEERKINKILPPLLFILILVIVGFAISFSLRYFISDIFYQRSLTTRNQLQAYNLQLSAINIYPYRDTYYRSISQTDIILANALASQTKTNASSNQSQQDIITLTQQAINAGQNARIIAPNSVFNWNNLSNIYRSLIGFGNNAEKFAILMDQQAIALDPNNPQQYIDLGEIYFQLGKYDDAIRQYQYAINLKKDYYNAYYHLGHALEAKGNLPEALKAYQTVKKLTNDNENDNRTIIKEITNLQKKINKQTKITPLLEEQTPSSSSSALNSQTNEKTNESNITPKIDSRDNIAKPIIPTTSKGR